jgi:cbb3-type cytochrome oxidase cytochrome c subunit
MYGYRLGAIGIVITFFAIIFSTVLMPMVLFNPKASGHGNDYDAQHDGNALRGRQIYVREGCFYCHTQFNRLQDRGYGPLVKAGDYTFETPHQLGTARTGPDLTNEGGRFPEQWQKAHLVQPRAVKPGSIMPSFSYLNDRDMNDLVSYIETLGNGRKPEHFVEAPDEYRTTTETGRKLLAFKTVDTNADASANAGRGIYQQNCASTNNIRMSSGSTASPKAFPERECLVGVTAAVSAIRAPAFSRMSSAGIWSPISRLCRKTKKKL